MSIVKAGAFKRLWSANPELVGSSLMALVGVSLGFLGVYYYHQKDGDNRRYKLQYTVIRDDDPRAARVRKD